MDQQERVVLLDDDGRQIGTALKADVHTALTPLHLAFSCHLRRHDGRVLVTRRALTKRTWPGTWTNAFCGHPAPGESMSDAIQRRARHELGVSVRDVRPLLPEFRYRAEDDSGVVENEVCPVFGADTDDALTLNPDEVMHARWVEPAALEEAVRLTPWAFSPWLVAQLEELARLTLRSGTAAR